MSILSELMEVTKVNAKPAEIPQSFLARITKKAGEIFLKEEKANAKEQIDVAGGKPVALTKDEEEEGYTAAYIGADGKRVLVNGTSEAWGSLSEDVQAWFNEAMRAFVANKEIESLDGLDEVLAAAMEDTKVSTKKKGAAAPKKTKEVAKGTKATTPPKKGAEAPAGKGKGVAAAANGTGRGRKGAYPVQAKIKLVVKDNPHRQASKDFKKFSKLKSGGTVQDALDAGIDWGYLHYAAKRELITVA